MMASSSSSGCVGACGWLASLGPPSPASLVSMLPDGWPASPLPSSAFSSFLSSSPAPGPSAAAAAAAAGWCFDGASGLTVMPFSRSSLRARRRARARSTATRDALQHTAGAYTTLLLSPSAPSFLASPGGLPSPASAPSPAAASAPATGAGSGGGASSNMPWLKPGASGSSTPDSKSLTNCCADSRASSLRLTSIFSNMRGSNMARTFSSFFFSANSALISPPWKSTR
mmetsp:Transcript_16908/g.36594  ORF Transcript_16908/g.36594 Transcript_16908/m.36594 type:complete len:228 (-) Transcript_16908:506-1189(-)